MAVLVASLVAAVASAEVTVRLGGDGRVDVTATTAPLPEVLDRLSRQTGMKVVYDGPPPRPLLTITLEGRTPVQAVLAILEGLGLNYAVVMDPTATRVQTLLMAGAATAAVASPPLPFRTPTPTPPRPAGAAAAPEPSEEPETAEETPEEESGPPAIPGQKPAGTLPPGTAPGRELPGPGLSPPVFPTPAPGFPGLPGMAPPNFPSSPFSPRLPTPTLVPAPSPPAGTGPGPEPSPRPQP